MERAVEQVKIFEEPGIGASVLLPGKKWADSPLEIGEHGVLAIPQGLQPAGFHLVLYIPAEARIVITQKNVERDKGGYHQHTLAQLGDSAGLTTWVMHDPIQVVRAGKNVWTDWHSTKPNRVDCWRVERDGRLELFQVGVITHDDGQTFRLLGEYRWRGRVFKTVVGELAAKPDKPKWGSLLWCPGESRAAIQEHQGFQLLLATAEIEPWNGREVVDSPLDPVPNNGGFARVCWYIPFAGQKGQGYAKLYNNEDVCIHGSDILEPPDPDGIKRLWYNDLISFTATQKNWGSKKDGPPKLLCVRKVR